MKNKHTSEMLVMRKNGKSFKEIGEHFYLSGQRIQQLLSPAKLTILALRKQSMDKCHICGSPLPPNHPIHHIDINAPDYNGINNLMLLCTSCHMKIHHPKTAIECARCHKLFPVHNHRIYCSRECRLSDNTTQIKCATCGKQFTLKIATANKRLNLSESGKLFCSRHCLWGYIGNSYGFGIHPENRMYK